MKYSDGLVAVNVIARPPLLRGELVNRNSKEEPVCLKHSKGLVDVNVGARLPVLKGELVNRNSREESVCSKCRDGLVIVSNRRSSGRARQ